MRGPYVECMIILENPSPSLVDTNAIIMDIPCVVRYMRWNQYPKSDDSDVYQERKCACTTNVFSTYVVFTLSWVLAVVSAVTCSAVTLHPWM